MEVALFDWLEGMQMMMQSWLRSSDKTFCTNMDR